MAVFDGAVKIPRAVADPKSDKNLPSSGSLSWGGIKSATGLAGTTGIDCKLVHGDSWIEVGGKHTEMVTGNVLSNMAANQTILVGGNHQETLCGTSTQTIIGPHIMTNMSVFNETRIGPHTIVHGELEMLNDEDGKIHTGLRQYTLYGMTHEIEGVHFEFAPQHFEIKINHFYLSGMDANCVITKFETDAINVEATATEASVKALKGDIKAMQAKLGALEAKATGCVATAGPDPNVTPLF